LNNLVQRFPNWIVSPSGGAKKQEGGRKALEVGPSESVVRWFETEVTLDQTFRNLYQLLNVQFILMLLCSISKYQQLKKKSAATALNIVLASAHIQIT
jgi:hypothetical protein